MGLAYRLDVEELKGVKNLSAAMNHIAVTPDMFSPDGDGRWLDSTGACQQIYPTGDYIIRDGLFVDGMFVYVGSYKAYIRDLFGSGSHGYAWDGFIIVMRGYSINGTNTDDNIMPPAGAPVNPTNFGMLPMRMPLEVDCGSVGDAAAIAADTSVGLHGIDIYKSKADIEVTQNDINIRIITCGFQRIDASVEGAPTGADYVGNVYLGKLLLNSGVVAQTANNNIITYNYDRLAIIQLTWKATQAGHMDNTLPTAQFGVGRDLDQAIALDILVSGGLNYTFSGWALGEKPDGTNPSGIVPPTGIDIRAISFNYYPRRFLDVTCFSQIQDPSSTIASPFYLAGDCSIDTNNDGSIDDTCAWMIGGALPFPATYDDMRTGVSPFDYQAPYLISHPSVATSLAADKAWFLEGSPASYDLSGAVAALVAVPYEMIGNVANPPIIFIGVNDVTHGGATYGEIYVSKVSLVDPGADIQAYASQGGAFTTASSIEMPSKWYGKGIQQRTFSFAEEDSAKYGTTNTETGIFTPSTDSIIDTDTGDYVGYVSNYLRYGLTTQPTQTGETLVEGAASRNGYGFLGWLDGTGPITVMLDSGASTLDATVSPQVYTEIALAEGANLNANHLVSPTSTTRKIVNAAWDNDRDQWLFVSSDTGGAGAISVSADFNTDSNNVGFLDQTPNFTDDATLPLPVAANAGLFIPITMSDGMDGIIMFGSFDTDANSRFGIIPLAGPTSSESDTCSAVTVTYDFNANTIYPYKIKGSTGRTARVWVDYVLFDGADSLIAKKLREFGMKVNLDNVEWFKRKIIRSGDLNIKSEEIEEWMREQQTEYKEMLKAKERQGRIRKRKSQVSAYQEGIEEQIDPDFMDDEVKDFLGEYTPDSRPPTPEEKKLEKKRKGGYEPETKSYYDDVFED